MGVLPDWRIRELGFIAGYQPCVKRPGLISYGVSSYGYDARVGYKFKVFTAVHCGEVDPKSFDPRSFVEVDITPHDGKHDFSEMDHCADAVCAHCGVEEDACPEEPYGELCPQHAVPLRYVSIPPNSFALAETVEEFDIPRDVLAVVLGKSTYARCGIIVNVTPLEPEWRGRVTVEISNTTPLPARIYGGEGIMQVLFLRAESECEVSYADKAGKYQDQRGIELPKVD